MKETWNEKYNNKDYLFGKEPNDFFKEKVDELTPGKALFIAEGEGRNAVYAAKLGWEVDANDFSTAGKDKALKLARENNVSINYEIGDAFEFDYKNKFYDLIVLINIHVKKDIRKQFYSNLIDSLKSGGKIILQVFDKEQITMKSGGPPDIELLYCLEDIIENFIELDFEYLNKGYSLRTINGERKKAAVIRFMASK